jgi:phage replication-related protein YjqB (UPF0714/DUF867 family)
MKAFQSYFELIRHEQEGVDFLVTARPRGSSIAVLAPHGGGIEPGTSELARCVAEERYSLYCFESLKQQGSKRLHIPSTLFDEPRCIEIIRSVSTVVALHGCRDLAPLIYVGGLDGRLKELFIEALSQGGFTAAEDNTIHSGREPLNVCNRGKSGRGVQLEISYGLRKRLFSGLARAERDHKSNLFWSLTGIIKCVIGEAAALNLW